MTIGPIYQIAFVVPDLDRAIADWVQGGTAGPFYRFDHFTFDEPACAPGTLPPEISIALGNSGKLNVELIQLHSSGQTVFSGADGLHHVARRSDDVSADCAKFLSNGAATLFSARFAGCVAMAYVDTRATLGCITELIAADPGVDAMLERMAADARDWDGQDPVRRF